MSGWLKKNALIAVMFLVTALTFLSLAASAFVFEAQNRVADSMLASYVADLADSFVENSSDAPDFLPPMRGRYHHNTPAAMPGRRSFFRMLSTDPSLRSGGVLIFDSQRRPFAGSEGAEELAHLWRDDMPTEEVTEVAGDDGRTYLTIVRQLRNGRYVMVAASRTNLLGSIAKLWDFWTALVMTASVAMLACLAFLWRYLVIPMRHVAGVVSTMRWGREQPDLGRPRLYEVKALSDALDRAASGAVAKEELRARYVGDIVKVQEDAKKTLSRELHDGPLQSVVASIKRIQLAQNALGDNAEKSRERLGEKLDEAERISQSAADEIRDYCEELSPSWVALGIASALEELADRLERAHGVRIELAVDAEASDLSGEYALALSRIMQEAVSNSSRHGGATNIKVDLATSTGGALFTIADNGRGFASPPPANYERLRVEGHRGLSNMHERAQLLGGDMSIIPAGIDGGPGCTIEVTLPN